MSHVEMLHSLAHVEPPDDEEAEPFMPCLGDIYRSASLKVVCENCSPNALST